MALEAAFMVPHPPLIIPRVGRGGEKQVQKTIRAYKAVADEIAAILEMTRRNVYYHLSHSERSINRAKQNL